MDINYRAALEKDYVYVFDLCERRFGKGYLNKKEYAKWLSYGKLFLVAECDGEFCGYSFMQPSTDEEIAEYMNLTLDEVREFSKGKQSVHYRSAALEEKFEGKGIMRQMTEIGLNDVLQLGCSQVFGPAWKYNNFIPMDRLLTKLGFEQIAIKENVWINQTGYECVICHGPCKCECAIYRKIF